MADESPVDDLKKDYSGQEKVKEKLSRLYQDVLKGFVNQKQRADDCMDYWDIYNCNLNSRQFYNGNSQVYVPIVQNAVEARKTRFANQLFPLSGRYVECVTESGDTPYAHMAILEHYVRKTTLRQMAQALLVSGDVEGQYSVYCGWKKIKRQVYSRVKKQFADGSEGDDIQKTEVTEQYPDVQIIPDNDLLVLPATADSIEDAIESGGSVTVVMRLSKSQIEDMVEDGTFNSSASDFAEGLGEIGGEKTPRDIRKDLSFAAGIKTEGNSKHGLIYQTWSKLKVGGKKRVCVTYFGGDSIFLGCRVNPYWCGKVPVISCPARKTAGVFKGQSPLAACAPLQYAANDAANEGMDSAAYSLLPIVMTDPEKNPRVGSMVLNLAAVWETSPKDTQILAFPQIWKEAFEIIVNVKNEIFQTLSVNPAMMPNTSAGRKKLSQAEIASEQQIDMLTTADAVTTLEEGLFTPLLQRFFEYDHQFRDEAMTVKAYGELGLRARMETIEPFQLLERYAFRWLGVETARNAQMLQQQIAAINVVRGIPPQMLPGRQIDLVPAVEGLMENVFGPRLAPRIFKDLRAQLSLDIETENGMLSDGFDVAVMPMDDDKEHLQKHIEVMKKSGDPSGMFRSHLLKHQQQMAAKQQMAMRQAASQAQQNPGAPGQPKPGSQPQAPAGMKAPAGAMHADSMVDAAKAPRL